MPVNQGSIGTNKSLAGLDVEADPEPSADDDELQNTLRSLVGEYGLVPILQALEALVKNQAVQFSEVSQSGDQVVQTLQSTAQSLHQLAESLPAELDIELALAQITHTAPMMESDLSLSGDTPL